jgi:hypothetical protein
MQISMAVAGYSLEKWACRSPYSTIQPSSAKNAVLVSTLRAARSEQCEFANMR